MSRICAQPYETGILRDAHGDLEYAQPWGTGVLRCAQPFETGILRDKYHYPLEAGGYRRIWTLLVRCIKPCIWGTRRLTYFGGRIRAFLLELATPGPDAVAVVAVAMSVEELGRGQALLFLLSFHFIYSLLIFFWLVVFDYLFWVLNMVNAA